MHEDTTDTAASASILSKKYPAFGYGYGGEPMFLLAKNWFEPIANQFNPFATSDPAVLGMISSAAAAPTAAQDAAWQQVQAFGVKQAWYVGVATTALGAASGSGVTAPPENGSYIGNELDVTPAS